ncbi:MAG: alpha/beta fold hydrolase, partial [Candidatus Woesearchaeota archaeon]
VEGLKVLFEERALDANLARAVSLAVRQHVWCNVSGICIEYPNILNLSNLGSICNAVDGFRSLGNESNLSTVNSSALHSAVSYYLDKLDVSANDIVQELVLLNKSIGNMSVGLFDVPSCQFFAPSVLPKPFVFAGISKPVPPPVVLDISCRELKKKCCLGSCSECCGSCSDKFFPVVFLHGHAFNKRVSYEYSLDAFSGLQDQLESVGIINAGALLADLPEGFFSVFSAPFSMKASYYFDLYKQQEDFVVVQTKSENIDSYAVRLNEIIDSVKLVTGRDKIVIVGHSMGGLVARRYLQAFGPSDVSRLILVAVPNKGVVGSTADYCPVFGQRLECEDMNSESLFMNKLNRDKPNVLTYNIVGVGCDMDGFDGDGVVTKENSVLDGAKNFFVNGTCKGVDVLHTSILDINRYPEVFEIVGEALQ